MAAPSRIPRAADAGNLHCLHRIAHRSRAQPSDQPCAAPRGEIKQYYGDASVATLEVGRVSRFPPSDRHHQIDTIRLPVPDRPFTFGQKAPGLRCLSDSGDVIPDISTASRWCPTLVSDQRQPVKPQSSAVAQSNGFGHARALEQIHLP